MTILNDRHYGQKRLLYHCNSSYVEEFWLNVNESYRMLVKCQRMLDKRYQMLTNDGLSTFNDIKCCGVAI